MVKQSVAGFFKYCAVFALWSVVAIAFAAFLFRQYVEWNLGEKVVGLPIEVARKKAAQSRITPPEGLRIVRAEYARLMQGLSEEDRQLMAYPQPISGYLFNGDKFYIYPAGAFQRIGWGWKSGYVVDAASGSVSFEGDIFCRPENIVYIHEESK